MNAHVYRMNGEWFVSLRLAGEEFDVAGPFDDELDATEMACRVGGEVHPHVPGVFNVIFQEYYDSGRAA